MKETLFDIISSHREWYTTDADCVGMKQAAVQYANELASLGNHWRTAFEGQIQAMFSALIPIGIDLKRYRYAVADFLANVRAALAENCGLGEELKQLSPSTQWIVGIEDSKWSIKEHLSKDEAALQVENLKQQGHMVYCFRELCSDLYTIIGIHAGEDKTLLKESFIERLSVYMDDDKIDILLKALPTITPADLKQLWYNRYIKSNKKYSMTAKSFFNLCEKMVPKRKGERGWDDNNFKGIR